MPDQRASELARICVNHSVRVKPGEHVCIRCTTESQELALEVYREVLRAGGVATFAVTIPGSGRIFYEEAKGDQLADTHFTKLLYENMDVMIAIDAPANTRELTNVDPDKQRAVRKAMEPLHRMALEKKFRWVLTKYPTQAAAQDADMSLEEYANFLYGATNVDYAEMERRMQQAAGLFNKARQVRIVGVETDLTIDIEGRNAIICAGDANIPDGEFFFTPNHLKTEGKIYFTWPTVYEGREISGIRLRFEKGRIVEYSAEKGHSALDKALNTDDGARFLGELGIGCNWGITKPTKNILFDEKIGGSIHIAVGGSYPEAGEGNISAIHWDLVKNLRDGGEIFLDGERVQKDGEWVY